MKYLIKKTYFEKIVRDRVKNIPISDDILDLLYKETNDLLYLILRKIVETAIKEKKVYIKKQIVSEVFDKILQKLKELDESQL